MRIEAYQNNILFSCVKGTNKTLKRNTTEFNSKGKESFKTYDLKGLTKENNSGQFIDYRI